MVSQRFMKLLFCFFLPVPDHHQPSLGAGFMVFVEFDGLVRQEGELVLREPDSVKDAAFFPVASLVVTFVHTRMFLVPLATR